MKIDDIILKLLEDQSIRSTITLLITALCGFGITWLNYKRGQLLELAKGAKRSALRSEYLQIYNSKEFTNLEKWEMTRPIIEEYFNKLDGNHYIHNLDAKLEEKLIGEQNG